MTTRHTEADCLPADTLPVAAAASVLFAEVGHPQLGLSQAAALQLAALHGSNELTKRDAECHSAKGKRSPRGTRPAANHFRLLALPDNVQQRILEHLTVSELLAVSTVGSALHRRRLRGLLRKHYIPAPGICLTQIQLCGSAVQAASCGG